MVRPLAVIVALIAGCSRPPSAMEVVDQAARAIGGRRAVEAANTLVIEGAGEYFALGQNRTPDGELIEYGVTEFRRAIDLANGRWRQEQALTPRFLATSRAPQKVIIALDGDVAFDEAPDGAATRATDVEARDRRAELRHSPLGILRAALAPGAVVSNRRAIDGRDVVDVRAADGAVFTLAVDVQTRLPVKVSSTTDQPNLGDVIVETDFDDYQPAGELKLPTLITSRLDRYRLGVIRVSKHIVNGEARDLAAPAAVRSAPGTAPAPVVAVDELAKGVWLLRGEAHHSVLVELADHLTLIEAPLDDARTLAVIARARQLQPAKPLTHVVVTHHHFDHSGGIRAAVSEGLTIIVHDKNREFVQALVARPHTLAPDALARRPRPLAIQTVGARTVLGDSMRTIELHAVDSGHADGMLVAHLPRERLLIEVDLYTPPAPGAPPLAFPYAATLLDAVTSRNMNVERVVPLHRHVVAFADLVAAAAKPATP